MLRRRLAAPGRLWLLLRYLDRDGRGWLRIASIKTQLTHPPKSATQHPPNQLANQPTPHSALRMPQPLCSARQLRHLLRVGEGIFWTRDRERIWLRSTLKVADTLGVERLTGRPVELPLAALLAGIGTFRAHLYAAFHSGRVPAARAGQGEKPIARATLARITGVSRRAQRAYEQRTRTVARPNYALGPQADATREQEAAWRRGRAVFTVKDVRGYQGRQGRVYVAWQLPNSYEGPHGQGSRCRQRHLNRRLADLRKPRDAGNDQRRDGGGGTGRRVYHRQAAGAARSHRRRPDRDAYWRGQRQRQGGRWWYALPAGEED